MNGQTELARRADSRVGEIKSLEIGTANSVCDASASELLLRNSLECSALHRHRSGSPPRGYRSGPQNGPSSEFMAVFSHEFRNSLVATLL